jgi:hypothetical protein
MNKLRLDAKLQDSLPEIESWLRQNVGPGARRYNSNQWLGTDDWFYYEDVVVLGLDEDDSDISIEDESDDLVFVFRRESDMVMFGLRWTA